MSDPELACFARSLDRPPRSAERFGAVAQLVERLLCKEEVRSSSLLGSTRALHWTPVRRFRKLRGRAPHSRIPQQLPVRAFARSPRVRPNEQWCTFTTEERRHQTRVSPRNLHRYTFGEQKTQHSVARAISDGRAGCWIRSSYKGHTVDALALEADEGRVYLRKAAGSW